MERISVIIPVHNGEKYIRSLYKNIKQQTFDNYEIIFVENFSKDNSLKVLKELARNDEKVVVLESKDRGTSLARKKGVEYASGKYVVFMDQDDKYLRRNALEKMYDIISETKADICQFSIYIYYGYGIKREKAITDTRRFFSRKDVLIKEIGSIFESYGGGYLTPTVWSKIYSAEVLKDAVKCVNDSLFFAEDYYLNTCCFLSEKAEKICVDPNAFYVWDNRFGFSSSKDSSKALIEDYNKVKPLIHKMLKGVDAGSEVFYRLHLESLYFMRAFLIERMNNCSQQEVYNLIEWLSNLEYIKLAKYFMNHELKEEQQFEELTFLSDNFTPKEFYDRYKDKNTNNRSLISRIKKRIRKG